MKRLTLFFMFLSLFYAPAFGATQLTLESAVQIALDNSFRTRELELEIQRSIYNLNAYKASLNTQVYMWLKTPDLKNISEYRWNSNLRRDEIVHINSNLWQSDLSIKQPLIFFGYPTNGSLSLNYRVYRYQQHDEGRSETDLYNRLYLKFEQPFFLPNELKNDLEEAELDLKDIKLDYIQERVEILEDISDDYFDVYELSYMVNIYQHHLDLLQQTLQQTDRIVEQDSSRQIERTQVQLEINNVKESLLATQSSLRLRLADMKQRLRLNENDSLFVIPTVKLVPIQINVDEAMELAYQNSPYLQRLDVWRRNSELDVENVKGRNAFHMSLEMTYGLEKKNDYFSDLWTQFDNSNSITLTAYLPIWDGGVRKNRIQAEMLDVKRRDLSIEEERIDIRKDVTNIFTNLSEFYARAVNMKNSIELSDEIAAESMSSYSDDLISLQDLLQIVTRTIETRKKFLDVYVSYRENLLRLTIETYFNFEKRIPLIEEFELMFD